MFNQPKSSLPIDVLLQLEHSSSSRVRWTYVLGLVAAILLAIAALGLGVLFPKAATDETTAPSPTPIIPTPTDIPINTGLIKVENAILRAAPDSGAAVVMVLDSGTAVTINQHLADNSWYEVAYVPTLEDGSVVPPVKGWVEANQLDLSPQGVEVAVFQPAPIPKPNFQVLLYQEDINAIAYVGSSSPVQIVVQSPDPAAANKYVTLSVEGSGKLALPDSTEGAATLYLPLDDKGYAVANFYALPPVSDVTIKALVAVLDGTFVTSDTLSLTTRHESLTLEILPEIQTDTEVQTNIIENLDAPLFFTIHLNSDSSSGIARNYSVDLALTGDMDAITFVQRNPEFASPPDPANPPPPFLLLLDDPLSISIEMQPNASNNEYGIVLINKETPPFTGTNTLTISVGDVTQTVEFTWTVPCFVTNTTLIILPIGKGPASGGEVAHLESQKVIRAVGRLNNGSYLLVDIRDIAPAGVSDTEGWLAITDEITESAACQALPLIDAERQPVVQNSADQPPNLNGQGVPQE